MKTRLVCALLEVEPTYIDLVTCQCHRGWLLASQCTWFSRKAVRGPDVSSTLVRPSSRPAIGLASNSTRPMVRFLCDSLRTNQFETQDD